MAYESASNLMTPTESTAVAALAAGSVSGNLTVTGNLQVDGTTLLQSATTVAGVAKFADGTVGAPSVTFTTGLTSGLYHSGTTAGDNEVVSLAITGVAKVAVSKAGMVINGASGLGAQLAVVDTVSTSPRGILSVQYSTDTNGARVGFAKARGTEAAPTVVVTGDTLGRLMFRGYDGANFLEMASIEVGVSGTVGSTRVPTYIAFATATDAEPSVLTERMRITNAGYVGVGTNGPTAKLTVTQAAETSGLPQAFKLTSGAHTGLTTTAEDIGVLFDLSATKTWAAGNIATQREFVILAPTYAFASASTVTNAATVYISGPPVAGANATITYPAALVVASGRVAIGSSSPTHTLFVDSGTTPTAGSGVYFKGKDASSRALVLADGARGIDFALVGSNEVQINTTGTSTAGFFLNQAANGPLIFKTNNVDVGRWDALGNLVLGTTAAGTTAAKTLALTNGATAPSASANLVHLYSADIAADRATLATWSEEAPAADVGLSSTHSYIEFINGVKYKRMLVAV